MTINVPSVLWAAEYTFNYAIPTRLPFVDTSALSPVINPLHDMFGLHFTVSWSSHHTKCTESVAMSLHFLR